MSTARRYTIIPYSESALLVQFEPGSGAAVLQVYQFFKEKKSPAILEIIPASGSLLIRIDPFRFFDHKSYQPQRAIAPLYNWVDEAMAQPLQEGRTWEIPVCYGGDFGPDLEALARYNHLDPGEVIAIHTACEYRIDFLGFLPGFAYMKELDERIAMPRKIEPVLHVMPGSVGIAGRQTGIYPVASPGGWQIIGRTSLQIFDPKRTDPVLWSPGDRVRFYAVTKDEYNDSQSGTT